MVLSFIRAKYYKSNLLITLNKLLTNKINKMKVAPEFQNQEVETEEEEQKKRLFAKNYSLSEIVRLAEISKAKDFRNS